MSVVLDIGWDPIKLYIGSSFIGSSQKRTSQICTDVNCTRGNM